MKNRIRNGKGRRPLKALLCMFFMVLGCGCILSLSCEKTYATELTSGAEDDASSDTPDGQTGFVVISGKTYYYLNGKKVTGLATIDGNHYYFSKKGVMKTKGFQKVNGKKYYLGKDGKAYTGFNKIGKKTYYFDTDGVMLKGLRKIGSSYYYFHSSTGVMQTKKFQTVGKKKYYLGTNGKAYTGLKTIKKDIYYFNIKGVMQKGWQTVNGNQYYFQSNGKAYRNKTKKIGDIYAVFNASGVYQFTQSYCIVNGKRMQAQYMTDPKVSDEILLAAILYAEAGGETQTELSAEMKNKSYTVYKGQVAVGYTIMNRVEHKSYPGKIKEVIYEQNQFEPARTGVLTRLLENTNLISSDCKNLAKILIHDRKNDTESIAEYPRSDFDWYNFWALNYARTSSNFFSVYSSDEYEIIGNQVFFNYTKRITTY